MKILLIGAGRMGLRHLRGLAPIDGVVHVVDPDPRTEAAVAGIAAGAADGGFRSRTLFHRSLDQALRASPDFDAAILAATAAGREAVVEAVAGAGVRDLLIEKPIEQSRARLRGVSEAVCGSGIRAHCNLYRRTLDAFLCLHGRGPLVVTVNSGAMGLGGNGIHWIDFVLHLSGSRAGRLVGGVIEETPIASGRGAQFRDYGGTGLFVFDDGSRLSLSVSAGSAAPTTATIVTPTEHWLVDQNRDMAVIHRRRRECGKPHYLYGQDCDVTTLEGLESVDLPALTTAWIRSLQGGPPSRLPTLEEALPAHELLFDLLETGGDDRFAFT